MKKETLKIKTWNEISQSANEHFKRIYANTNINFRAMNPETLRAWRIRFRLLKGEAAEVMGVSRVTYARWEQGTAKIPNSVPLACAAFALNLKGYGE